MKKLKHPGLVCLLLLAGYFSVAQEEPAAEKIKSDPAAIGFKISANYNSGLNYYGRTDSLRSSGFYPLAELWLGEKFYINAAPVFVNNRAVSFQYAGTIATAGYQFTDDDWAGNLYFLKPFYQENAELVQVALKAQSGVTLSWLNKYINITAGADIKFSDKTDYGATAGLDHIFRFQLTEKSVLVIDPSVYVNAGTQQFTKTYLKKTPGFLLFPGTEQVLTESAEKFSILSYEFSAPVIFAAGKLQLLFTPAYVLPQNLIVVEGRPDLSERGRNMFYMTAGVKMSF